MQEEILNLIKEKGLLVGKEVFDLLDSIDDTKVARNLLEGFSKLSGTKVISGAALSRTEIARELVRDFEGEEKKSVEKIFVKLGVSLEISREREEIKTDVKNSEAKYKVFYPNAKVEKKIEVADFVRHFRDRYQQLQRILMQRSGLKNLTSINKLAGNRQAVTIIGIVADKRKTKNGNLIITFEDLTGRVGGLAKAGSECFTEAEELQMDDVVAITASGNNEMLFIHEIMWPEAMISEKTRFEEDMCVAFLSDVHVGSTKYLGKEFEGFLDWLNKKEGLAGKIRYLFFSGDNVDGIGVYPGQEVNLNMVSYKEQYAKLAELLKRVPKDITMFMIPGQHDSVWRGEPQPVIDNFYGRALYDVENLVLLPNPAMVKLLEGEREFKILMYHGDSIHDFNNNIEALRLSKASKNPAKAIGHMLKRRHIAPVHSIADYVPNGEIDPMVISEIPDVFCTGEVHRVDIENHNGILAITGGCWQTMTEFEEKMGNDPDPCKVPVLNLKTRELKILDFSERREDGD